MAQKLPKIAQKWPKMAQNSTDISAASAAFCISGCHQKTNRVFGNNFTQKIKTHRVPLCFQDKWSSEKSRCLKTCWCFKLWLTDVFILTFSCFDKYLCFHIFSREVHVTVKDVNEYIPEWGQVSTQLWWSWWWWWSRWWWCDVCQKEEYAGQVEEGEMSEAIVTVDATDRWSS